MNVAAIEQECATPKSPLPLAGSLLEKSFLRNSVTFAVFSLVAYLVSFFKTVLVTRYFGTSASMDAFSIAVLVPNLLAALVSGSTAAALIPALSATESRHEDRSNTFRGSFILFGAATLAFSILLSLFASPVLHILASKFDTVRFELAVHLLRLLSPLLFLNAIYAYASAELLSRRKYAAVAGAPAVSTLFAMVVIFSFHDAGISVLAWALILGTAAQALAVVWPAWRATVSSARLDLLHTHVLQVLKSQVPLIAVSTFGVANVFIDQTVAGFLPVGSVSAFNYASSLNGIVMQTVVMAVGWVALPEFSALVASGDFTALKERARRCIIGTVLIAAPVSLLVMVLGGTAIRVLLQRGEFTAQSTHTVFVIWIGYSLGLVPVSVGMLGARMINALQAHSELFKLCAVTLPLNAVLDVMLMRSLGVFGISLSTSLVYLVSVAIVFSALNKRVGSVLEKDTCIVIMRAIFASIVAIIPLVIVRRWLGDSILASAAGMILFGITLLLSCRWLQLTLYLPDKLRSSLRFPVTLKIEVARTQ